MNCRLGCTGKKPLRRHKRGVGAREPGPVDARETSGGLGKPSSDGKIGDPQVHIRQNPSKVSEVGEESRVSEVAAVSSDCRRLSLSIGSGSCQKEDYRRSNTCNLLHDSRIVMSTEVAGAE
jgi:hypothetical protein